ncbi:MAG: radical SAM protein [Coriobacteriales bacterium]|jgi:nitrogen fixation protein NifB|nr:radical SAM protein [Coriobacteriales bacterium]
MTSTVREVTAHHNQFNARATVSCTLDNLQAKHPCFALGGKPNNKGRIHLPVSPACNIACKFCERSINTTDQRPGVTGEILTPEAALDVVGQAVALAPDITVVGIAGPGDTLATPHAFKTFRLVKAAFPQMIRCMSTNGLLLADKIEELLEVGIDTLTVTVNEVDPRRLAQINDRVVYKGRLYTGLAAAELLIVNQLEGIRLAAEAGVLIKVNTVLVPGVNDAHIGRIAHTVKKAGAGLYNIIPLIPNALMSDVAAPSCVLIDAARADAERHLTVFRHCQHCRADAIGVPGGKDYGEQIYRNRVRQENTFSHG